MDLTRAQKVVILLGIFCILGGLLILTVGRARSLRGNAPVAYVAPTGPAGSARSLAVHVVGAVFQPGVYYLAEGARVGDAIKLAGGFLPEADETSVNLAAYVQDGEQINVRSQPLASAPAAAPPAPGSPGTAPANPAQPPSPGSGAAPGSTATAPKPQPRKAPPQIVSLNRATKEQLEGLPGIGPELAAGILYYRQEHGGFRNLDELLNVKGIGPKRLERLRPYLTL